MFPDIHLVFRSICNQSLTYQDCEAAVDAVNVQVMMIPELGQAPRAFSFLDNLINDVEIADWDATPLYEDQKFVTRDDLEKFGMAHLLKASVLRPYMHGFFVPRELYRLIMDQGQETGDQEWMQHLKTAKQVQAERQRVVQRRKAPKTDEAAEVPSKRQRKKQKEIARDSYYAD
jgi:ribosome biogenesis protein ENP2